MYIGANVTTALAYACVPASEYSRGFSHSAGNQPRRISGDDSTVRRDETRQTPRCPLTLCVYRLNVSTRSAMFLTSSVLPRDHRCSYQARLRRKRVSQRQPFRFEFQWHLYGCSYRSRSSFVNPAAAFYNVGFNVRVDLFCKLNLELWYSCKLNLKLWFKGAELAWTSRHAISYSDVFQNLQFCARKFFSISDGL